MSYRIVRFYQRDDLDKETLQTGLTHEEAQAHCNDPESSSRTATSKVAKEATARLGAWFDGFEEES